MKRSHQIMWSSRFGWALAAVVLLLLVPKAVPAATNWTVGLGAQSGDASVQAMAFLPNEVWIDAGDSVTWSSHTGEAHTVSFLLQPEAAAIPGTFPSTAVTRPSFNATGPAPFGCAGNNQGGAAPTTPAGIPMLTPGSTSSWSYVGTECVNSGPICVDNLQPDGQSDDACPLASYTVTFENPGNYKLVCLIHSDMTGVVHVAATGASYPHPQSFYDNEGVTQTSALLNSFPTAPLVGPDQVVMGSILSDTSAGGKQYAAYMRFYPQTITVNQGAAVVFENDGSSEPHTITIVPHGGNEPPPPVLVGATPDPNNSGVDGTVPNGVGCGVSGATCLNSGLIGPASQDQTGLPQTPTGVTRAIVTFNTAGVYNYYCILHDDLGMLGEVIVLGNSPLTVTPGPLPAGNVGVAYSQQLVATGGTPPYTWTAIGGAIPNGFTLSTTGVLSGTTAYTFANNFYVKVTDSAGKSVTPGAYYSLAIH